jgi:seryl-tRNA synthetase
MQEVEGLRAKRNKLTKDDIEEGKELKVELKEKEESLNVVENDFLGILYKVPNVMSDEVPVGKDASENKIIRSWGKLPKFDFTPKDHVELGKELGIIDQETAAKVTGARFNYLVGDAVLLQNALHQLVISVLTDSKILKEIVKDVKTGYPSKPFIPVTPPLMVKADVMKKMARHDPVEERYFFEKDNLMFVGSAEHSLGPMLMDETLNEKEFPIRYFAFTPAFRREAGSYGKDTRGILRQHQFDKIEMESFTTPENGQTEQDFFVAIQEYLMQKLEIPYQVVAICTGDMGAPDFRQIDIESWMPGQNKYRETHTSDFMSDFQSRRLGTKVRLDNGENKFVYMNDATVFAMGRIIIAILENFQQEDGSVLIPKVLQKWMGKEKIEARNAQ